MIGHMKKDCWKLHGKPGTRGAERANTGKDSKSKYCDVAFSAWELVDDEEESYCVEILDPDPECEEIEDETKTGDQTMRYGEGTGCESGDWGIFCSCVN